MKEYEITQKLKNYKNGTFIRIAWKSNIESAKARKQDILVEKITEATVRLGVNYSNIAVVKVKRALEEPSDKPKRKSWFKKTQNKYIVEHIENEEKQYIQVFSIHNKCRKNTYLINGTEATRQEVIDSGYCNVSTFATKEPSEIFNISLENLIRIGNK